MTRRDSRTITEPLLALGLLAAVLLAAWFGLAAPLLAWQADRSDVLADRERLASRLETLAATLPALRRAAAEPGTAAAVLLQGATDAVAGAALQDAVQEMAGLAGATLASIETLPAGAAGSYRRIGLRVSLTAPWPVLVGLLQAIEHARPRMLVDDLELQASEMVLGAGQALLGAGFTLHAFRADAALRADR